MTQGWTASLAPLHSPPLLIRSSCSCCSQPPVPIPITSATIFEFWRPPRHVGDEAAACMCACHSCRHASRAAARPAPNLALDPGKRRPALTLSRTQEQTDRAALAHLTTPNNASSFRGMYSTGYRVERRRKQRENTRMNTRIQGPMRDNSGANRLHLAIDRSSCQ